MSGGHYLELRVVGPDRVASEQIAYTVLNAAAVVGTLGQFLIEHVERLNVMVQERRAGPADRRRPEPARMSGRRYIGTRQYRRDKGSIKYGRRMIDLGRRSTDR
jgi:hypothetical protein